MHNNIENNQILTLSEVATYLKISEKTLLRMIHKKEMPCFKVANQWRFERQRLEQWLKQKVRNQSSDEITVLFEQESDFLPLSRFINPDFINLKLKPGTKDSILKQLIAPLVEKRIVKQEEKYIDKLLAREDMASTCVGRGVALPHIRNPKENQFTRPILVIGVCPEGTNFEAPDKGTIFIFFLIYTNSELVHLRILAKLNMMLRRDDFIEDLLQARSKNEIIEYFISRE